jgi:transcriptional regulator with XRE-family HTH domain
MKTIYSPESIRFCSWLRNQREARGLTMREAGNLLGKPHSFVAKVETGQRRLDVVEYARYCKTLCFDAHLGLDVLLK